MVALTLCILSRSHTTTDLVYGMKDTSNQDISRPPLLPSRPLIPPCLAIAAVVLQRVRDHLTCRHGPALLILAALQRVRRELPQRAVPVLHLLPQFRPLLRAHLVDGLLSLVVGRFCFAPPVGGHLPRDSFPLADAADLDALESRRRRLVAPAGGSVLAFGRGRVTEQHDRLERLRAARRRVAVDHTFPDENSAAFTKRILHAVRPTAVLALAFIAAKKDVGHQISSFRLVAFSTCAMTPSKSPL